MILDESHLVGPSSYFDASFPYFPTISNKSHILPSKNKAGCVFNIIIFLKNVGHSNDKQLKRR